MKSRKSLLKKSRVYLILDIPTLKERSLKYIYSIISSRHIDLIQLRDKKSDKEAILHLAIKLSKKLAGSKTLFIVNDHLDLAAASGADGAHLGQDDLSLKEARRILGKERIIGISCHNPAQALKAQNEGADYVAIGPVYATATKPEYKAIGLQALRELKDKIEIPYFAIGDIREENIKEVVSAGASRIAVCRAILKADNPKAAAGQLYKILNYCI